MGDSTFRRAKIEYAMSQPLRKSSNECVKYFKMKKENSEGAGIMEMIFGNWRNR